MGQGDRSRHLDVAGHLPHRPPFLLVDRVLEREPGVRVVAEALITGSVPPSGFLLIEMLAQAAGFLEADALEGRQLFLAGVPEARFEALARVGDRLRLEVAPVGAFGGLMKVQGAVSREAVVLCAASFLVKGL